MGYNKLLERQIRRYLKAGEELPAEFRQLLEAISNSYDHYEADRNMLERSLDLSSQELNVLNDRMRSALLQIAEKNRSILDSINYARRIQRAILPSEEHFIRVLPDSFVWFRPKDIISGDFYWYSEQGETVLYSAADCTGHGVPGALMSMISTQLLNEAVNIKKITSPHEILDDVRSGIISALRQQGENVEQKDGMDATLCVFNRETNKFAFSGANNSIYIIRKGEEPLFDKVTNPQYTVNLKLEPNRESEKLYLYEIKPDKQPVGFHYGEPKPFTSHEFQLNKGDTVYTFSDGYADQFGGPKGKKFKYSQLKQLFLSISHNDMQRQRELLEQTFENWKGQEEQVDDVVIIGMRS
jgi:serine phosphatase RsbU (regulator of sigma subunit)